MNLSCPFCEPDREVVGSNEFAFAIDDLFPVSPGHTLIIPKRHVPSLFDLKPDEYFGCWDLVRKVHDQISSEKAADGFNIGNNVGIAGGQTVEHAHIHLIPRYEGDVDDPTGGVRHVIPGKGRY